jgi:hypothetical protein
LRRKYILGAGLFFEKNLFLGKTELWKGRPNVGEQATGGKKATCRKRRKSNMQEEMQLGAKVGNPNQDRVRFFDKYCNDYKP